MRLVISVLFAALLAIIGTAAARDLDDYIREAAELNASDQTARAMEVMQAAVEEYPENPTATAYLGLYTGMRAGQVSDYMEAGRLVSRAFELLDEAVAIDHDNVLARYFRGIMGVSVPDFLGKNDDGVRDLEYVVRARQDDPESVSDENLIQALNYLGRGYVKQGKTDQAVTAFTKVVELAPGTPTAGAAAKTIEDLKRAEAEREHRMQEAAPSTPEIERIRSRIEDDPENPALLVELGRAYMLEEYLDAAEDAVKESIAMDSSNAEAYTLLADVLGAKAGRGYDEKIYEDTDYMTNLAFEIMRVTDEAVKLDPENMEMRLRRGIIGVEMPFFVGRLDDAIQDLRMIVESDADDELKSQALFYLGRANLKKTMTYWIRVVTDYPDHQAARMVFQRMNPGVTHVDLDEYEKPLVAIEFVLGYKDELPPQTAVWVETESGDFVKTVYVSGFSGFAKEQQINLPVWSSTSDFVDVDGVTSASIDLGHYIYVWDLKDHSGNTVKPGEYVVKVETSYWPSMKYQMVEAPVTIGSKEMRSVTEEGNYIPYLEAKYVP